MKNFMLIVLLMFSNCLFSQDVEIDVSGKWKKTIRASEITEAGNDYVGTYESASDETEITIEAKNKNKKITVFIRKEDDPGEWHPNLVLQIKRTDNNNNNSTGGLSYQTITDFNSVFFYTKGKENVVPIQYRINGISVLLPVQDYTTTIVFTVFQQ